MKKILMTGWVMCCLASCGPGAKVDADKFLITGQLRNVPDSTEILVLQEDGTRLLKTVMKDTVMNGAFTFSDTTSCVKKFLLLSNSEGFPNNWLEVWVAPGEEVKISGENKLICVWKAESDVPEQLEANAFQDCAGSLREEYTEIIAKEADWFRKMDSGAESREVAWKEVNALREKSWPMMRALFKKEIDYMQTAPIGRVWLERLEMYAKMVPSKEFMPYSKELKALYARLPEELKQCREARIARQYLYPSGTVKVGDLMADADLYDIEGRTHRLAEFKGKYILLDFWTQGCGPCIASLPEIEEISEAYADSLVVVSISLDPEKAWKDYVKEKRLSGHQWNELAELNSGLAMCYQVKGYPSYVLVAPDGRVKAMWGGYGKGSLWRRMKELFPAAGRPDERRTAGGVCP